MRSVYLVYAMSTSLPSLETVETHQPILSSLSIYAQASTIHNISSISRDYLPKSGELHRATHENAQPVAQIVLAEIARRRFFD